VEDEVQIISLNNLLDRSEALEAKEKSRGNFIAKIFVVKRSSQKVTKAPSPIEHLAIPL
jgi:hypothetical protein